MFDSENLRAALRGVGGFGGLSPERLDALISNSRALAFAPGEFLMRQGEPSDHADFLIEGEAEICADSAGGPILIALLRGPALVGAALAAPSMLIDALARLGDRLRRVNGAIGLYTRALEALERGEFTPDL